METEVLENIEGKRKQTLYRLPQSSSHICFASCFFIPCMGTFSQLMFFFILFIFLLVIINLLHKLQEQAN